MKSATQKILRRVVSGHIKLTPGLLHILKILEHIQSRTGAPEDVIVSGTLPGPSSPAVSNEVKPPAQAGPRPDRCKRRAVCATGLAFFLAIHPGHATTDSPAFDAANHAFAQNHYAEAAQGYEVVLAQSGNSAPVLFNLANCQLRDGQLGRAILNYERAALLDPRDPDIAMNLNLARQKAGVELERESSTQMAARTLTINTWFGLVTVALFLFTATWPLQLLRPQARPISNIGRVLALVTLAVAVGALGLRRVDLVRAVVVTPEAAAGISPVTVADPVFKLRAGEIVTRLSTHGDFALVRNRTGHEGWVNAGTIEQIIPADVTPAESRHEKA